MICSKNKSLLIGLAFLTVGCANVSVKTNYNEQIAHEAIKNINKNLCLEIQDKNLLDQCVTAVKDESIKHNALNLQELSYCDMISTSTGQIECTSLYKDQELTTDRIQSLYENNESVLRIIKGGKIEDCNEIKIKYFREECLYDFYITEAFSLNDPRSCKKIGNQMIAEACMKGIE